MVTIRIPTLFALFIFCAAITACIVLLSPPKAAAISDKVCERVFNATREQCVTELENRQYDGGSLSYLGADIKKDIPICDHIATTALNTCNEVGQGIALPGPSPKGDSQ